MEAGVPKVVTGTLEWQVASSVTLKNMVVKAFGGKLSEDPLAEEETRNHLEDFLILKGMGQEEIVKCFRRLEKSPIALSSREAIGLTAEPTGP